MKKIISTALSFIIMFSMCNIVFAQNLTTNEVTKSLTNMAAIYSGKYWNGNLSEATLISAVDKGYSNPNNSYSISEREHALGLTHTKCSGSDRASGCVSNTFGGAMQCMGFARFIEYVLFGVKIPTGTSMSEGVLKSGYTKYSGSSLSNLSLQPGDYLNCPNHSAVVWKVENGNVYVIQVKGTGGRCVIDYDKFGCSCKSSTITESNLRNHLSFVIRPTSYVTEKSICNHKYEASTEKCKNCGAKFERQYQNVNATYKVIKNDVSVKSQPYSECGKIYTRLKAGTKVTVNKQFRNIYNNIWYEVSVNGTTGYMYSGNLEKFVEPAKKTASSLKIDITDYPKSLKAGSSYGLRGSITSNYKITKVEGYVTNSSLSSVDKPNSTSMNVKASNLNNKLTFNKLGAGNYTLVVTAYDASGKGTTVKKDFTVYKEQQKAASTLSINLEKYPVSLNVGSNYGLRGSVTSNYNISEVRGYVINSSGNTVLSSKDTPNAKSMDIRYADLNNSLKFGKLSAGNYTMKVVAYDVSGRSITATKNFKVGGGQTSSSTRVGIVNIPSSWDNLSIRTGPSTNYKIVGSMPQGARCTVYPDKASNGWYYVNYNGVTGYASGKQINLK